MGIREDLDKYKAQANRAEVIASQCLARVKEMDTQLTQLYSEVVLAKKAAFESEQLIKDRTKINVRASGHPSCDNQIIVTGTYHCSDYVEIFNIPGDRMDHLMHQLRIMRSAGVINKIDAPKEMAGIMKHELRYSND